MNNKYHITGILGIIVVATIMLSVPLTANAAIRLHGSPCTIQPTGDGARTTSCVYSGLGNQNLLATLSIVGFYPTTCTNPGGNVAPGQSDQITSTASSGPIVPKNGKATIPTVIAHAPQPTDQSDFGCPNPKWTGQVSGGFVLQSATFSITQGNTQIAFITYP